MIVKYRIHMMNGNIYHTEGELISKEDIADCKWFLVKIDTPDWSKMEYINVANVSYIEVLVDNGERITKGIRSTIEEVIR